MDYTLRSTICGAGIGAGLMFLLDPATGARRRSLLRDKVVGAAHKTRDAYDATRRDIGNRLSGASAESARAPEQRRRRRLDGGRTRARKAWSRLVAAPSDQRGSGPGVRDAGRRRAHIGGGRDPVSRGERSWGMQRRQSPDHACERRSNAVAAEK